MNTTMPETDRRSFLKTAAFAAAGLAAGLSAPAQEAAAPAPRRNVKLGLDNFAVRALKWKAPQLIDYAASLKTDSLFITDLGPFEKQDDDYLRDLRRMAADKGVQLQLGSWSICPTSRSFRKDWGTAEEHLALGLRMARALGSAVFRVILGAGNDRATPGGIEARIADTVKVLQSQRSRALDAGVKIAVENHAGDMQAWELVTLIEAAGKDFVGANIDPGNAAWTLEDPVEHLEVLGPYVLTSSMRDSAIWETPNGATVQWTAMGDGVVDFKAYMDRWMALCPHAPVHIETISGFPREFPFLKKDGDFWKAWPQARAKDLAKFIALAKKGKPIPPHRSADAAAEQEYQKAELERSLKYCKEVLGLGLKS
jgi:sugar phosphate isomerase/epimerase